ncbi:response regulator [Marinobacter sp. R17]|uniref:response regulator transcription factor n=1 Tax=Marinobacter sp. R17 TaxID=2484250 RepID=UPI000F4B4B5C|nr:DNA-binding response regulator [Marinobacter sp. R17]ROU01507.1 response regulator [Marinobacter sp. R17]
MNAASEQRTVVLVVDDAVDSIRMINDVLEEAGMTVLVALEGAQALTITQNIAPDIILLDAIMPNMDGFETCRRLRERSELMDVPIIFMTGLSDTEHVVMGLKSGGVDYVTKPINANELVARMSVHLANARMARSARSALDHAGQNLMAVDGHGQQVWATPQVQQLLKQSGALDTETSERVVETLSTWLDHDPESGHNLALDFLPEPLTAEFLARIDNVNYLLRLSPRKNDKHATETLRQRFGLTAREADVLLWIANGKTNREIGQILEMSPRTVNKHLEQIFRKQAVENRTSAAAAAIKCLGRL